jgi:protein ImuB
VGLETDQTQHRGDSLWCEISGVTQLFGGELGLLAAVERLLAPTGLQANAAIADSLGAAWAVAHFAVEPPATRAVRPKRFVPTIVPPGGNRAALEPLPVAGLRIGPETVATLARLGVSRIGQLLQLPRSGLAPRLGKLLVHRLEQALGEIEEPIEVYRPPTEHLAVHRLEYATADRQILADRIERLIETVRAGLATCQRGALRMACRLDLAAHPPLTVEIGLFAPTIDAQHLNSLFAYRLESMKLPSAVECLTISVLLTGPLRSEQTSFFEPLANESNQGVSRLVDSLSGRLGTESVVGVRMGNNPLPEKAFSILPLAGNANRYLRTRPDLQTPKPAHFPSPDDALRRPLSLLSQPMLLAVSRGQSPFSFHDPCRAIPERIRIDGTTHRILRAWGSERIETGWWNGPSIRRDYYRIETDSGQWLWIFRNLVSPATANMRTANSRATDPRVGYQWMLHGFFS